MVDYTENMIDTLYQNKTSQTKTNQQLRKDIFQNTRPLMMRILHVEDKF